MRSDKGNTVRKHFRLNAAKLKRAQELLGATTESETVELALDMVIAEYERSRVTERAYRESIASDVVIRDVYERLE